MLDPIKLLRCPVAEHEGHTSSDLPSHWLQIRAVALCHDHLTVALLQRDCESSPLARTLLVVSSHCKGLCRVNRVAVTGSIVCITVICQDIHSALATMIALVKDAVLVRRVASM